MLSMDEPKSHINSACGATVRSEANEKLYYNDLIQARNMKKDDGELTIQEHSVSRNEASIFQ